jgi:tRNA (mo5U34)-methyltransferase
MLDQELALKLVRDKSWNHDFEIIPGVRTHGACNPAGLWQDLELPNDLDGLSLVDLAPRMAILVSQPGNAAPAW